MDTTVRSTGGSLSSESTVLDSEEDDRAFIELDRLFGLPPPRFDLGAADIDPRVLDSADNGNSFDPEIEFALPHKPGLPRRMDLGRSSEVETEVCFDKKLSKVSVLKSELTAGSVVPPSERYVRMEPVPAPSFPPTAASGATPDEMLYKRSKTRGKTGVLNRVVSKLLAKSDPADDSILQTLLLDSPSASGCDNPVPKTPAPAIPSPVINRLKKLGTSVEVEKPPTASNGQVDPLAAAGATAYLQIMETLDKAVGLTSDLTKKKKRKSSNNQVPSLQMLAEIDNSDNMTKFSFQVDAKQVMEFPDGKLYTCDICSGVYHRGFSLKRHYLKTHINYKHISKRDLHNCGILFDPCIEKGGARKKQLIKEDSPPVVSNLSPPCDIPDLYRCHTCGKCFMLIHDLKTHLMEHPPVSVQNLNQNQFKNYSCPNCKARYQKKKLFLLHKEMCGKEVVPDAEPEDTTSHYCLYCDKSFPTFILKKKHHLQMHHPKKKLHQCYLCKTKMFKERLGVFKHLLLHHPDEYIGCLSCKLRFGTREEYKKHNKENHKTLGTAKKLLIQQKLAAKSQGLEDSQESRLAIEETVKTVDNNANPNLVLKCTECPKMFACYLNMTRHRRIAHRLKKKKKVLKKDYTKDMRASENRKTPTPPPPVLTPLVPHLPPPPSDPEVLFYSTIAHNIRENLTHHLDGKLDSQEVMEYDLNKSSSTEGKNKVLNFSAGASFSSPTVSANEPEATSTPVQQKEPRTIPISPRAPWEKFNFPKNYDGRCGLTSYIKDMSHLDISTQLTMRRNLQRLNSMAGQEANKESPASIPAGLLLVERLVPDCAEAFGEPDNNKDKGGELVLSGEWVRPRKFLCSVCGFRSSCLWEVEDHKYAEHPNVWVPHVELVHEQSSAWDWFYHRRLPPETEVTCPTTAPPPSPLSCSKCGRQSTTLPDLHRHMLECGGDTSWQSLVSAAGGRRRRWRFGSRRRKHQGRRGLKRNIPNTPAKHSCGRIRTKPGDMDTIQKMIANLPAKRARRAIGEDLEIKTRSQATINSVPISSLATHSSAARHSAIKASKSGKVNPKTNNQKKIKIENISQEDKMRNKDVKIKTEPVDEVSVKEERVEKEFQPLEAENMVQHSDILTSLQMIRVVRASTEEPEPERENLNEEEPIDTSKILAAMREAMLESRDKVENKVVTKPEKRKKSKVEEKQIKTEPVWDVKKTGNDSDNWQLIICNGCGMQFDNASSCQRHKKKCVYWKEDKSSENKGTNKCSQCGSVFPYLMALLKHNCSRVEVAEEPAMPELCPEQPVEEMRGPGDSVEDIPILSPVDISRDETTRRMSLFEATINLVSDESFDVIPYHQKYFKTTSCSSQQRIDQYSNKNEVSGSKKKESSAKIVNKHVDVSSQKMENSIAHKSLETMKTSSIVKSPGSNDNQKNKKVSEIFKEIKRGRGRKRNNNKVKITKKLLGTKVGLRKPGLKMADSLMKRKRMDRRKRTSNFLMLIKEFEKLQKEGAVAIGKRKRICSNSESDFRSARSRRRIVPSISNADYADIDSVISDLSDIQDMDAFLQSSDRKSARSTNPMRNSEFLPSSQETLDDGLLIAPENIKKEIPVKYNQSPDVTKGETATLLKAIKEEPAAQKRKPGRPPLKKCIPDTKQSARDPVNLGVNNENIPNKRNCVDKTDDCLERQIKVEKEEPLSQELLEKRKPGRPRFKSITEETEQHIQDVIDTIIKRECNVPENSKNVLSKANSNTDIDRKVVEDDNVNSTSSEITKPNSTSSEITKPDVCATQSSPSNQETDEHILEAIESVLSQSQNDVAISREVDWAKIDEIIYNVSIGSAETLKEPESDVPCVAASNSDRPLTMKRKRKKRKRIFTKFLKRYQYKQVLKENSVENMGKRSDLVNNDIVSDKVNPNSCEAQTASAESTDDSVTNKIKNKSEVSQTTDLMKKLAKVPKEEINCSVKPKEAIKTKQLSIEDYLTISHYVKGTSVKPAKEQEKKNEEGWKVSNNTKETDKEVHFLCTTTKENSKGFTENANSNEISKRAAASTSKSSQRKLTKQNEPDEEVVTNLKPLSPSISSSREDISLSVIKDKVIKKRRKKLKLKKLLKNKHIDVMDSKISKITKPKISHKEDRHFFKEKLLKKRKKIKVGVSRNRWEVSVVENKNNSSNLFREESKTNQLPQSTSREATKRFYCSICDVKFESSYKLYQHQLTAEHNLKSTVAAVNKSNLSEENDPVKYCKSIGNIINDLEKRTLNVAKVMNQLKQKDGTDVAGEGAVAVVESTSSPAKEEWGLGAEWWEGAPLDVDNNCTSSLGTLMVDTVNKLLSSDQDLMSEPPCSLSDLQLAMGASDEEMAMLFQLGEHSLQEEYVYDSSRPAEDGPTLVDLDHQSAPALIPATPDSLLEVPKKEPLSDSEDSKGPSCRAGVGKMLGDYENKEMVCPTCNKHFLGLPALQTHVAWSHCAPVPNATRLKRRALLNADEVDRRLVCFVCKEIVPTATQLEAHIQAQHTKKSDDTHDTAKPVLSEAAEKLRSKMSLALGGLVDRALNKLLGTGRALGEATTSHNQPSPSPSPADLNSGALQLLGRLCAAKKRIGNENLKLSAETLQLLGRLRAVNHKDDAVARPYSSLADEMRAILARGRPVGVSKGALAASVHSNTTCSSGSGSCSGGCGGGGGSPADLKPTNLLDHLAVCSSDVQERPYACPICDLRFLIPSTRNRHIARAHGKYGRRYDEEVESLPSEDQDQDWKSPMDLLDMDANDDGEMLPLCSDCGLSFQSIHDVMRHRIEDHPRRFSADFQEEEKPKITDKGSVVESSSEIKETSQTPKNNVKLLPVSDSAIDSTSTVKKKRGRPAKLPELKTSLKRKCPEQEMKCLLNRKSNRGVGRKRKQLNDNEEEHEDSEYISEEESLYESSREESSNMESNSPETDKSLDKMSEKLASRTSSEENLAELSRKLDRRKVRMGNMAEDAVRVKAEAALRELNLAKKQKSPSSAAKWGINAVKFTKNSSTGVSSSQLNGSPSKPRFASLGDKKWKIPPGTGVEPTPKIETIDVKPDIYDFRDEEMEANRKPVPQQKGSHSPEDSDSNKSNTWSATGSPRKASRVNPDNS